MSLLVLLLIVSSGSFLGSVWFRRKYSEVLPMTFFSIVLLHYILGLFGGLRISVYLICFICFIVYFFSIFKLVKDKLYVPFAKSFFSSGFWVFLVLFFASYYFNIGKYAMEWDDFSHWADVVKAMLYIDDFAANPASNSAFRSYLPAMSLFQYFDQSLIRWIEDIAVFDESRLHFSYQIFTYALIMPFVSMISIKKIWLFLFGVVSAILLPSMFYKFYSGVLIDPFLGILCGYTFTYIVFMRGSRKIYRPMALLSLIILALTKDSGQGIAVLLAIVYALEEFLEQKGKETRYRLSIKERLMPFSGIMSVLAVRYSWKWVLAKYSAPISFDQRVDIVTLIRVIAGLEPDSYRTETLKQFWQKLLFDGAGAERFNLIIPFSLMLLLLIAAVFMIIFFDKKNVGDKADVSLKYRSGIYLLVIILAYIIGTCVSYMFKFSEYEAIRVAGFNRYLFVIFTMISFVMWFLLIRYMSLKSNRIIQLMAYAYLGVAVVFSVSGLRMFITGGYIRESQTIRSNYSVVEAKSENLGNNTDRIYFISQGNTGYDYWTSRFLMRPQRVNGAWSLGKPLYEGDVWTQDISVNEWEHELRTNYDYVLLYKINESFIEDYSSLFRSIDEISEGTLYHIEKTDDFILVPIKF